MLLSEKRAGEACSGLRVGLAVDACQVALHHAQRNPQVIGYLLERALVGGYGAQYFFLARGQAASADELGLHLLKCRGGRGGKARLDGLAFPDRGRQAKQPGGHVSGMETPDTVNAHRLLAARPMPAHSCGVCMRGASCKNVVVKNVTKNPELT